MGLAGEEKHRVLDRGQDCCRGGTCSGEATWWILMPLSDFDFDDFVWFWFWCLCLIVNAESLFTWDCRRGYRQVLLLPRNIWREGILKQCCVFIISLPRQEHLWGFCEVKEETIFPDFSGWKEFYYQRTILIRYFSNLKTRLTWWYRRKDVWPGHRCWG